MLEFAVPEARDIRFLKTYCDVACVTIYMPGATKTKGGAKARWRTLTADAMRQLYQAGFGRDDAAACARRFKTIGEELSAAGEEGLPAGLAFFVSVGAVWVFALPQAPQRAVAVGENFYVSPLSAAEGVDREAARAATSAPRHASPASNAIGEPGQDIGRDYLSAEREAAMRQARWATLH